MRASVLAVVLGVACSDASGGSGPEGPVVVELFTSQGCSSCPPADRLLATLANDTLVAPLSFHIDYWNDLGWVDPYSQAAWTERQHRYARALGDTRVYTPELVVGGTVAMVGSNASQVRSALDHAPHPALLAATARWLDHRVEVTATAPADADVVIAIWETERSVKVASGENAGATLSNARIVRRLERVAAAGTRATITLPLDPAWRDIGAVAFAQRPDLRIVASAMLSKPRRAVADRL